MVERRKEQRLRSLLGGEIRFTRPDSRMDCVVRNIAPHGALVVFPQTSVTPREFLLTIPHRGETHVATVVWRRHDRAGVTLTDMRKTAVPLDLAKRVLMLEAENRRLRRQIDAEQP